MGKKMLIDATHPEETRVVVVDGNKIDDFDFESLNKRQLAGNIYLAKVTRVEPSLQAAFVDYGGNRHGFLAFAEIHPDYYQIPVADREALLAEERAAAQAEQADEEQSENEGRSRRSRKSRSRKSRSKDEAQDASADNGSTEAAPSDSPSDDAKKSDEIKGLEVISIEDDDAEDNGQDLEPTGSAPDSLAVMGIAEDEGDKAGAAAPVAEAAEPEAAPAETQATEEAVTAEAEEPSSAEEPAETVAEENSDDPYKSMAESTGLDDERISEEVGGAKSDEDQAKKPDETTEAEAETAASPEPEAAAEAPATEVEAPQEVPATEEAETAAETATENAPEEASASDAPAEALEASSADSVSETPAETPSDAEAAAPVADDADSTDQNAEAEAKSKPEEGETKPPRKRSRRSRKRKEPEEEKAAEPQSSDEQTSENGNGDHDAPTEVESVGAEDLQEEVASARANRRRRYKIQDVIKVRQIMLVQVVKEERGNKGAALTTYLSLAGRYCVLMPNTARGGGISRKITQAADRKRLREIVDELEVPQGRGLIVRTAGAERTRAEIKRDYEFLLRQWEQIRDLTLQSVAPCLIYEEGSLIKRSIRDLYSKEIDSILVEGNDGYREAKAYMKMLMPSHAKNVQEYGDQIPLFVRYQAESYLNGMFSPTVQLKSGGYIVIGITEALVAVDVNSGRATKQGSIEETALQTNLEAADEIARQCRLRDLAGLIVIDFIDMEEGRNNRAVEKRMKDRLKSDRARIQIGRISSFGLMEMSRQRLRPGMLEATTQPCPHCQGMGIVRSDENMALSILREVEEEAVRGRAPELVVTTPVDVSNFLINHKREHIAGIESRCGVAITILADPSLTVPDFSVERAKAPSREAPRKTAVVSAGSVVTQSDIEEAEEIAENEEAVEARDEDKPEREGRSRRRRGKRGGRRRRNAENEAQDDQNGQSEDEAEDQDDSSDAEEQSGDAPADEERSEQKRSRRGRRGRRRQSSDDKPAADEAVAETAADQGETPTDEAEAEATPLEAPEETPAPESATVADAEDTSAEAEPVATESVEEAPEETDEAEDAPQEQPAEATEASEPEATVSEPPESEPQAEPVMAEAVPAEAEPEEPARPKRRGWWSLRN